jgi:UDP-glucose 4-epimerase
MKTITGPTNQVSAIVFGGAGFLGSHIADELTARGYSVTIFDLRPSPWLQSSQKMVIGNILDKAAVINACAGMDVVYNFAGMADIGEASQKPEQAASLNIMGNLNMLEAARQCGAKRFIFASTVYVYSNSGSFYRATKQASESFVELYGETYRLPFTILRYGSLYGRRSDDRNAIYQFVSSALKDGQIHYKGTGEELREYIHVEDAARASVDALSAEYENQHIILTGQRAMKVRDLMVLIAEMLQKEVKFVFEPADQTTHYAITPYAYKPKIGRKLVTNPFVDLGQGVLDCIHEIDGLRLTNEQARASSQTVSIN